MKKLLVVVFQVLSSACAGDQVGGSIWGQQIRRFHDDADNVTCWTVVHGGGIDCIPDRELTK